MPLRHITTRIALWGVLSLAALIAAAVLTLRLSELYDKWGSLAFLAYVFMLGGVGAAVETAVRERDWDSLVGAGCVVALVVGLVFGGVL